MSPRRVGIKVEAESEREKSRPPRPYLPLPVTIRCGSSLIEGYAERLTGSDVLVQALGVLPPVTGECEISIELPLCTAVAHGSVTSLDPTTRTLSVEFTTLDSSGHLLLAAAIAEREGD